VMLFRFIFNNLDEMELNHCRQIFNSLPFTWGESGGTDGFYATEVMMPENYYSSVMHFLRTELVYEYRKIRIMLLDATDDLWYTIPYYLFKEDRGGWYFDESKAIGEVLKVIPQVKHLLKEK
jgi:hypothetical protein